MIPAYNAERFVRDAVASALGQEPRPHEVLVVDDGSTDRTVEVLAEFGEAIRLVQQGRSGVAGARNRGIEESTGEYLAFLDADDLWLQGKLAAQLDIVCSSGASLVGCGYLVTDAELRPRYSVPGRSLPDWVRDAAMLDDWGLALPITALVAREVIEFAGGFSPDLSTSADLEFALRVVATKPTACVETPLAVYRTHSGQMHHDLQRLEHDMLLLYERLDRGTLSAPWFDVRRAHANLHTRLMARRLMSGDWGDAAGHLRSVLQSSPGRLAGAPIDAALHRLKYAWLARVRELTDDGGLSR